MTDYQPRSRHRGRKILLTCLAVLVIFIVALCLFLRVTEIRVDGDTGGADPQQIIETSGIRKGQSMLLIDRAKAGGAVQNAFPALSTASVNCTLPGLVTIKVNESQVRAVIEYKGERWVLDENCHVIGPAEPGGTYVTVTGLEVSSAKIGREMTADTSNSSALTATKTILTQLAERGLADKVSSLDLKNLANIEFTYDKSFVVKLGSGSKLEYKLERFASVIQSLLEEGKTSGTIDVSIDGESYYSP